MPRVCQTCGREVAEAAYCPFCSQPTIESFLARLGQRDALTIRKLFNRRKQWILIVCVGCFLIAFPVGGLLKAIMPNVSLAYFAPFFAGFAITVVYARFFAFRCPRCGNNWGVFASGNNVGAIDRNIRYCPFCSVDIDAEIDPVSYKPTAFLKEWGQRGIESKNTDIQLPPGEQKANTDIQLPPGKADKEQQSDGQKERVQP